MPVCHATTWSDSASHLLHQRSEVIADQERGSERGSPRQSATASQEESLRDEGSSLRDGSEASDARSLGDLVGELTGGSRAFLGWVRSPKTWSGSAFTKHQPKPLGAVRESRHFGLGGSAVAFTFQRRIPPPAAPKCCAPSG